LSKNAKIGIISGIAGVAVLVLFFAVLLPLLTKSKLAGRYEYDNQWIICEDGVYVLGYTDWDYIEVGTYEIDDDEVEFTTAGEEYSTMYLKFNAKDNYLKDGGTKLKCKDKKATLDFEPNKEYIKNIEQTFQTATENVIASDSDIYESALDNWYFIYEDDFEDPGNDFEKALAKEMDYDNNECLQYMLTEAGLAVDIDIDSRGNVTVDAY
ncbi:MAG: hypothetical protein J5962_00375, partial [Lachnospiraceae bacterium]|nr:hypothetical protein [Lachnospiraceae bacterium]